MIIAVVSQIKQLRKWLPVEAPKYFLGLILQLLKLQYNCNDHIFIPFEFAQFTIHLKIYKELKNDNDEWEGLQPLQCSPLTCDQVVFFWLMLLLFFFFFWGGGRGQREMERKGGEKITRDTFILQDANRPHY